LEPENAERIRLAEDEARTKNWKRWGPYLAERQWATVREDYSPFSGGFLGLDNIGVFDRSKPLTGLFGGNSNWRGPIWFPVNYRNATSGD